MLPYQRAKLATQWVLNDAQGNATAREILSAQSPETMQVLWLYAIEEYREMIIEFCSSSPMVSQPGNITPLQLAAFLGRSKVVGVLVENGADPNLTTEKSVFGTQLLAVIAGAWTRGQANLFGLVFCYYCVAVLLAAGADPNMVAFGYFLAKSISPMDLSIDQLGSAIDQDVESNNVIRGSVLAE
ncbi:hypothetical protein PG990_004690 [Apiospora arundinis]